MSRFLIIVMDAHDGDMAAVFTGQEEATSVSGMEDDSSTTSLTEAIFENHVHIISVLCTHDFTNINLQKKWNCNLRFVHTVCTHMHTMTLCAHDMHEESPKV